MSEGKFKCVLKDQVTKKYFREMSGIGPRLCAEINDAFVFDSELEAKQCPAYTFSLCCFDPERCDR